jgi:spermidine synthase
LAATIAWAALQLTRSLPYWPIDPSNAKNPWHNFQLDIVRCLWAIFPAAFLWGASFPLALAAAHASSATGNTDAARLVGRVYAANTVGAILGALLFSMLLVGMIGSQRSQQALIGVAAAAAVVALAPLVFARGEKNGQGGALEGALLTAAVFVTVLLGWSVPPTPGELIAHGRRTATRAGQYSIVYQGEGATSSVAVTLIDQARNFHVSGKIEASSEPQDMRLQRMLGHIPALVHPAPKSVLVVGCGAGVTAGSFLVHPTVERVVICEIEPLIPQVVAQYFAKENYGVVTHPKVQIVYDDARHYILTTREKFDIITSDPINPWVKGAATLYTREYFELCRSRLSEGGVITQWVPLYESNLDAVKSELATFFEVFPDGTVWSNDYEGQGYDVVLLGHSRAMTIDVDRLEARLGGFDHVPVRNSLDEVGFPAAIDLLATYAGTSENLRSWLSGAVINRDRNLRLQYLAGLSAHDYREIAIYNEMRSHCRYPDKLFVASSGVSKELKRRLGIVTPD